ncbi:TetR/AcrR family transcriptional regulator [Embleya sp. NPDC050493]|uniref:TetR/AcrR family transcriptional regulator n=1 Tax=Embleya sp. NPDC050493 TaxID=3363989 RepID=UPI0037A4DD4C
MDVKTSARSRILDAAERLFAARGVADVSLREINSAAEQRNKSAVQYHFGTREALVRALYEDRLGPLNQRRWELLNALPEEQRGDLRALVQVQVQPLAERVRDARGSSCYMRFIHRFTMGSGVLDLDPPDPGSGLDRPLGPEYTSARHKVTELVVRRLGHLPADIRAERLRLMTFTIGSCLADIEARLEQGHELPMPFDRIVTDLVDATLGLLTAPSTRPATTRPGKEPT